METCKSNQPGEWYLITLAFCSGMTIMGVEICSSRLMAPFFGTSLLVWTVIIGATMIALSLGYYVGGILAERHPHISYLSRILLIASGIAVFLPYLVHPVMETALSRFGAMAGDATASAGSNGVPAALIASAVMIAAPLTAMGMTAPFIIRVDALRSPEVGRIAGRVFAFSTIGSILGTFLPALALIPLIGTRFSFLFFGGMLLFVAVWALEKSRLTWIMIGLGILVAGFLLGMQRWGVRHGPFLVDERETAYQLVQVFKVPVPAENGKEKVEASLLLTDAGLGVQSLWIKGRSVTDSWQDLFSLVPKVYSATRGRDPKRLLLIGLGGGCAPYLMAPFAPETIVDGVEIDGGLIEACRPYFPLESLPKLNIHVNDGRLFLRTVPHRYDIVVVDAFRPPHIPYHLTTMEFFKEVSEHLNPDGLLAMNIGCAGKKKVFSGIANSAAAVFPNAYFAQYYEKDASPVFISRFLFASKSTLALDDAAVENRVFTTSDTDWRQAFQKLRDPAGYEAGQTTYFRKVLFNPDDSIFLDDRSSLDLIAEQEFSNLIFGR